MKKLLFSCLLISASFSVGAQVVVDNTSQTVSELIQNVLVGEGVDVFNVEINGQPGNQIHLQAGAFMDADTTVGLSNGIILGTGNVLMAQQPNEGTGSTLAGVPTQYSYPPLEALTAFSVNDQCVIEFDFIPQGDTLRFNYIFASEEYPEYVCGTVNDVFGFFLSGNNPDGGVYANENLALIPDPADPENYTTTPVSINTLNPGVVGNNGNQVNCDDADPDWMDYNVFYVSNTTNTYEYDGRTVVLTARAIVNCGETYHITMAIGDGGDTVFDSGVFLEAGSFAAAPTGITAQSVFPLGLVEISNNCDTGFAYIGRNCASDTIYYQLNYLESDSSATYGVDYEDLPTELMMIAGQTDIYFPIQTIADGITEPTEWICIELLESAIEGGPFFAVDTACVQIIDNYTFDVQVNQQVLYCPETVPVFNANPLYPAVAPYTFEWFLDGTSVSDENPYNPPIPAQYDSVYYDLNVVDYCGAVNNPTQALVANNVPSDPTVQIITTGEYCPGIGYSLTASHNGGTAPFTYIWTDEFGETYDNAETIIVDPQADYGFLETIQYHLIIEDNCNPARVAEADIVVTFPLPLEVEDFMSDAICVDQVLSIGSSGIGGYPPYTYTWTSNPQLIPTLDFPLLYGFIPGSDGEATAAGFFVDEVVNPGSEYVVTLEMNDWCSLQSELFLPAFDIDTVTALNCIYPNVVSPNDDGSNDTFIVNEMINRAGTMFIYNRWGNLLSESSNHEWRVGDEPDGTYFYVVQFEDGEKNNKRKGYFTILR